MSSSSASCYYPNGDLSSDGDIPCGDGDGVACCPLNWTCADNGLCFLANQNYYGRYTCTDQSWKSSGCPNICTHDLSAAGAEAVLECDPGSYCCDANRPDAGGDSSLGCCNTSKDRFGLNHGAVVSSSGNAPSSSAAPVSSSSTPQAPSSTIPQVVSSSTPPTSTSTSTSQGSFFILSSGFSDPAASVSTDAPTTTTSIDQNNHNRPDSSTSIVLITSVVLQSDGASSTVTTSKPSIVAAPASTSSPSSSPTPAKSSSKASIIAPAVAIPVAVLAIAALAFFLWRRRKQKKAWAGGSPDPGYNRRSEPIDMYAAQKPHFPDVDSPEMKVSPTSYESPEQVGTKPDGFGAVSVPASRGNNGLAPGDATRVNRTSELPGSTPVSPGFSQMSRTGTPVPHSGVGEVGGLHITNPTPEPPEPSELPASTYHAYRPPQPGAGR